MSSLNSFLLSFSFCVFFFSSCSSFVLCSHHVHHIKVEISSRWRMVMVMTYKWVYFFNFRLHSAEQKRQQRNSPRGVFISPVPLLLFWSGLFLGRDSFPIFEIFPDVFNHIPLICQDLQSIENVIIKLPSVQLAEQRVRNTKQSYVSRLSRRHNIRIIFSSTLCFYEWQSRNLGQN